jgi:PTH1 family peptidyl-tRNA hydrolase
MWMIVGLGNPGERYAKTRHNAGFAVVDAIAGSAMRRSKRAMIGFKDGTMFVEPMTSMNASGEIVGALARLHGIPSERVVVVHDDLETPIGTVSVGRGHRGHNGMRSVLAHAKNAVGIRVGIGRPPRGVAVAEYVLGEWEFDGADVASEVFTKISTNFFSADSS